MKRNESKTSYTNGLDVVHMSYYPLRASLEYSIEFGHGKTTSSWGSHKRIAQSDNVLYGTYECIHIYIICLMMPSARFVPNHHPPGLDGPYLTYESIFTFQQTAFFKRKMKRNGIFGIFHSLLSLQVGPHIFQKMHE